MQVQKPLIVPFIHGAPSQIANKVLPVVLWGDPRRRSLATVGRGQFGGTVPLLPPAQSDALPNL